MFEQAAILGPGLLGSSLARALRSRSLAKRIHVWARRSESRQKAARADWCDAAFSEVAEAAANCDLVVLCVPVERIIPLLHAAAPALRAGALVTDVGSTKSQICREARSAVPPGIHFIGSHPMAGSEKTGMENGRAELFHGAACLVTPLADTPEGEIERVVQLWSELGMLVTTLSPERHDEIVAHVSHLPHLLASALCGFLINRPEEWKAFAGNGLRDTTRIAAGDPVLWRSIVQQNRDEILRALVGFEEELQRFRAAIANEEDFRLQHLLEVGKTWRDRLPSPK